MKQFCIKATCEYLVSIGCVAESGMFWYRKRPNDKYTLCTEAELAEWEAGTDRIPAFDFEDILRKANAEKIWGDRMLCTNHGKPNGECCESRFLVETNLYKSWVVLALFRGHPRTWPKMIVPVITT